MKKLILLVSIFVIGLLIALWNPFESINARFLDAFVRPGQLSTEITLIAIDDKSLAPEFGLGRFKDWPRSYYSQLLRTLNENKPAVVGFNLDFSEAAQGVSALRLAQLLRASEREGGVDWYNLLSRFEREQDTATTIGSHPDDLDLQKEIDAHGNVVLQAPLLFSDEQQTRVSAQIKPIFTGLAVKLGFSNVHPDDDGVFRFFLPQLQEYLSFPYAVAEAYASNQGGLDETKIPNMLTRIDYHGLPRSYNWISFVDVLAGKFDPTLVKDKIVLVGEASGSLQSLQTTPIEGRSMSSLEIAANEVQQILDASYYKESSALLLILTILVMTLGVGFALFYLPLRWFGLLFAGVLLGYPALAFVSFQQGVVLNVVYPALALILTTLGVLWYRNESELKGQRRIKEAFSHYVSPVIVNELVKNPETLTLGGRRENITVMFSDIVGFTSLSEKLSPEDTVAILNDYLTAMTEVIFEFHGTLDKYQGDAIMALFGAPLHDESHQVNACHSALRMRQALSGLHEKWNGIEGLPMKEELIKLDFRVGIASGNAVIGNVGSEKRFDYTAIGDIVNLGSRLESINRKYGTQVIVDKETFTAITEGTNPFCFRKLDIVRVKGKQIETDIFEVMGLSERMNDEMRIMLDDFENGRLAYCDRNFIDAKQYFTSILEHFPDDGPSQIYKNRCEFFLRTPPPRDWSPIVKLDEK
ncbi:hypothetical protein CO046_03880 [Candidatus Peregrinibacteria bacterium CG_4_9_14_0_2_um_filter_53_11]|nr:MAG: hypothetical protein CO046_03880 [Candidatus Peregrinibacteria bacterium CG_4_9_14_0_2_um_filter_53_11]